MTPRPTDPGSLFSAVVCRTLHFPCRFVSDHPCCQHRTPLNMAARARAMDGSPDLKWRGARRMNKGEGDEGAPPRETGDGGGESGLGRLGAVPVPSFISYTSTDTKAKLLESIAILTQTSE